MTKIQRQPCPVTRMLSLPHRQTWMAERGKRRTGRTVRREFFVVILGLGDPDPIKEGMIDASALVSYSRPLFMGTEALFCADLCL